MCAASRPNWPYNVQKKQRLGAISTATDTGEFAVGDRYGDRQQPCDRLAAGKMVRLEQVQLQIVRPKGCRLAEPTFRAALHFVHSSTSNSALVVCAPKRAIEPATFDRSSRPVPVIFRPRNAPTPSDTSPTAEPKGRKFQGR